MHYKKKIISITIYLTILFGACFAASKEVGSYLIFIDIPSIIIVVIIALALWRRSCLWRLAWISYWTNINEC